MLYPFTLLPTAILIGVSDLIGALAKVSVGDIASYGLTVDSIIITPFDILFNKIPLVDVNFFNFKGVTGTILQFRQAVAGWYYTMRLIASMVLLVILIYIGIRMALTSIATEKAMYKKMLVDWITSLALVFLLHYIILFVFSVNEALVNAMATIAENTTSTAALITINGANVGEQTLNTYDNMMASLQLLMFHWDIVVRITAIVIFGMLVFQTLSFLVAYIKRMFTIGFLIIIAPLITITYSMDRIGDGKAQALNTWLKEFIYNILLQPFQCILYLVFAKLTFDAMLSMAFLNFDASNVGTAIFAILSLHFIKEGEKIVKKIFGFDKASTAGDLAVGAALTAGAIMKGGDIAKKYGGSIMKGKNKIASSEAAKTMKNFFNDKKIASVAKLLQKEENRKRDTEEKSGTTGSKTNKDSKEKNTRTTEVLGKKVKNLEKSNKKMTVSLANMEKARQKVESDRAARVARKEKRNLSGTPTTFGGAVKKSTGQALGGLRQFAKDHRKEIASATIGMMGAGMGLASGDFGDFSKSLAGYNMGKGFTQGIYANSGKELQAQTQAASQLYANMTGDGNAASQLASAQLADMNDIKKSINEALRDLKRSLGAHGIKNASPIMGSFNQQAMDKKLAGNLTEAWISEQLSNNGFKGDETEKRETIEKFKTYGALIASQSLASNIQSAEGMGLDRDTLAEMMGNKVAITGYEKATGEQSHREASNTDYTESGVETTERVTIPTQEIADLLAKTLSSEGDRGGVDITNLEETNARIKELNAALEGFKASDDVVKDEILRAISVNNQNIHTHEDVVTNVEQQIANLRAVQNQGENNQRG